MATTVNPIIDIDRETGELISGWPRCKQSIITILTTRLRMRVMRLWWGSRFLAMQDRPGNQETMALGIMAAVQSVNAYEPEFRIGRVIINEFGPDGRITITVEGEYLPDRSLRRVQTTL